MIAERFPELLALPDETKLQLATELFADVVDAEGGHDGNMAALLDLRLAEYREHPERVSTCEEVKARIVRGA